MQGATVGGIKTGLAAQSLGVGQQFKLLFLGQPAHVDGLEQLPFQNPATAGGQGVWSLLSPADQVVARPHIVVGQERGDVEAGGLPQPAGHHGIGKHPLGAQGSGRGDGLVQQPVAHHVEPVVVNASVHQIAYHEIVLNRHQPLGVEGEAAVGGDGEGGKDPFQIQLAIAGARAVAVAQQVIEPVTVELAAHQGRHRPATMASLGQQLGHRLRRAGLEALKPVVEGGMLAHQPRRPRLMAQPEHLLAGVTEGGVADVMEKGGGMEHPLVPFQLRLLATETGQGATGQMQHAEAVSEAA